MMFYFLPVTALLGEEGGGGGGLVFLLIFMLHVSQFVLHFTILQALQVVTGALKLHGGDAEIYFQQGNIYKDLNNMQQAKQVGGGAIIFHKKCGPSSKSSRYHCDTLCVGRVVLVESELKL